jgi:PAS domain S-box-containing protein
MRFYIYGNRSGRHSLKWRIARPESLQAMNQPQSFIRRMDSLLEGIQIIGYDWRYLYLNDVMAEHARTPRKSLIGHTVMEKFPGIEKTDMFGVMREVMDKRRTRRTENLFVYPDGSRRWFDLQIQPDEAGICVLSLDITESKRTQALVVENEKRLRALIEKSADMKTMSTASGEFIYGSPSITKLLGYTLDEMRGKVIFGLFHPKDVQKFLKRRETIINAPGSSFPFEVRVRHKEGNWMWCEGSLTNLLDEPGVNAMVSNFRDITDKKTAEQQREFDQKNLHALINNSNDLMWSVDLEMRLITSNIPYDRSVLAVRGRPILKGENALESAPPEIQDWLVMNYQRAFTGEIFTETAFNAATGKWFEVSFHPISKGGEVVGTACHSRDVTHLKELEENMRRNNTELRKANHELDRFVYSISHDLRSPLTSILGLLELIESESREPETLGHAAMIRTGINRLDRFIKNVLNYSRNNRQEPTIGPVPLPDAVNQAVLALGGIRECSDIDFKVDFTVETPFHTDAQGFNTIVENLVSNAIKFHRPGAADKFISITGKSTADRLSMEISDNGIGIEPEYHERIFDMFFRLSGKVDGSGIGLYIVQEIVSKLGGTIAVRSVPGTGTTFYIELQNLAP